MWYFTRRSQVVAVATALALGGLGWKQTHEPRQYPETNQGTEEHEQAKNGESFVERTISDPINLFTLGLLVCAAATGFVIYGQLGWMKRTDGRLEEQIRLARDEFVASHRPRLVLRRVTFHRNEGEVRRDHPSAIKVELANVGETAAKIADFSLVLQTHWTGHEDAHSILRALEKPIERFRGQVIPNGGSFAMMVPSDLWERHFANQGPFPENRTVYCFGYACYTDDSDNTPRRMGFMLRCDPKTLHWVRTGDLDFEYAD